MVILGLIDSKPSSAAILIDGQVVAAISEERLCRMKQANGMPRQAIAEVMHVADILPQEIDAVAVAQRALRYSPDPTPWPGWFEEKPEQNGQLFSRFSSSLAPYLGNMPITWQVHHTIKAFLFRERHSKLPALLREQYHITAPVNFYDHHFCHAASAYYSSNFERALVVTLDGGGDGRSGSVYVGDNGRLREISGVDSFHSLGNIYSYITALCGFKAEKHEGKITGLAALGEPIYADTLRQFVRYQAPGRIRYQEPIYFHSALKRIRECLPEDFKREDLAASVQLILEEVGTAFVQYWLRQTGLRNIAVAGGVFANVKFNQRVHELPEVDNFFVYPAMDDSGLAVGGALVAQVEKGENNPAGLIQQVSNVYYGPEYTENQIWKVIESGEESTTYHENIHEKIAHLLADGYVVARFTGRMEYGPRALGHRSILYQTTDPSVNDWLNERLARTEFMPFAPATLVEYAHNCYDNLNGATDPARFMTITFNCSKEMRETSPGVVHVDGTARPQIVDSETSPDFYAILSAYHKLTGIPSLINTSFNMHGEPIVCTPEDAVRSFQQGNLDYLAIGNWLVQGANIVNNEGQHQILSRI